MPEPALASSPSRWRIAAAFAAVYLIWGSTYLGIQYATESIPPFLMAAARFLIAGALLYGWLHWRGTPPPLRIHWRSAAIIGALMLVGGNGAVTWAESGERVPSGLAALIVAAVPLWMALLDWIRPGGHRPTLGVAGGLLLGFAGIALLIGPGEIAGGKPVDTLGALALVGASLSWSIGSLYSRHAPLPKTVLQGTAMEMLAGGVWLLIAGLVSGEGSKLALDQVSLRSFLSLVYLTAFGSILAFSAYTWLLQVVAPARAATYAYVNPVVAVLLGAALHGETLTSRTLIAATIIVGAVLMVTTYRSRTQASATSATEARRESALGETRKLTESQA